MSAINPINPAKKIESASNAGINSIDSIAQSAVNIDYSQVTSEQKEFLQGLLVLNPNQADIDAYIAKFLKDRPNFSTLKQQNFVTEAYANLKKLQPNSSFLEPVAKAACMKVIYHSFFWKIFMDNYMMHNERDYEDPSWQPWH